MRTDLDKLCPSCLVRTAATCPACGSTELLDLCVEPERSQALVLLDQRVSRHETERARWVALWQEWRLGASSAGELGKLLLVAAASFAFVLLGAFLNDTLMLISSLLSALPFVLYGGARLRRGQQLRASAERELDTRFGVAQLTGARATEALRGVIRGRPDLVSPIGAVPCVAYRVVGECGRYWIDDAEAVPFELESETGQIARVLPDHLALDLSVVPARSATRDAAAARRFLERRGIYADDEPDLRAEAVLRDGDEVLVRGPTRDEASPEGYRDVSFTLVFAGTPDQPVRIQALVSPRLSPKLARSDR